MKILVSDYDKTFYTDEKNIKKENIYTIGDDASDLEMIKNFNGYAMKNATDEIKKYALKEFDNVYELIDLI